MNLNYQEKEFILDAINHFNKQGTSGYGRKIHKSILEKFEQDEAEE